MNMWIYIMFSIINIFIYVKENCMYILLAVRKPVSCKPYHDCTNSENAIVISFK